MERISNYTITEGVRKKQVVTNRGEGLQWEGRSYQKHYGRQANTQLGITGK